MDTQRTSSGIGILTHHLSRIPHSLSRTTHHASLVMLCLLHLLRATLLTWKMMEIVAYKPNASSAALQRIRSRTLQMNPELIAHVADIIEGVRAGGDEALIHYTEKFDGV